MSSRFQLTLPQEVGLILAQVILIQLVWWTVEMLGEPLHRLDVVLNGGLGVVAPLEFLQHHASEMGHRNLLVTHTLREQLACSHA